MLVDVEKRHFIVIYSSTGQEAKGFIDKVEWEPVPSVADYKV
jgi:hypothetical protein